MTSNLIWTAKQIGVPGSIGFLALCIAGGLLVAYIGPRCRRVAKASLMLVFGAYLIGAMPFVSVALAARLPAYGPIWTPDMSGEFDIVVVLSGDNPFERARLARQITETITPRCVLISGGSAFMRKIVEAGVSRDRLLRDSTAATTREQIAKLPIWASQCGAQRVVLIASTLSMPRVAALIRTAGVPVVLAPSGLDGGQSRTGIGAYVPSPRALRITRDALYEHVALKYYRSNGWIQ